jgi:hypothetical protein
MLAESPSSPPSDAELLVLFRQRIASGELMPLEEGVIFTRVLLMQNPTSGRCYTNRQAAELLGVSHPHLRRMVAVLRPYVLPKDAAIERERLRALIKPSSHDRQGDVTLISQIGGRPPE